MKAQFNLTTKARKAEALEDAIKGLDPAGDYAQRAINLAFVRVQMTLADTQDTTPIPVPVGRIVTFLARDGRQFCKFQEDGRVTDRGTFFPNVQLPAFAAGEILEKFFSGPGQEIKPLVGELFGSRQPSSSSSSWI